MAVGRVEDPPLALGANPGPRLVRLPLGPHLQHVAVLLVVLVVHVGLVPGAKRLEALHDRVRRVDDLGVELARAVPLELGADQGDVLGRIEEAIRRAVQRHEAAAAFDVVEQGLFLVGLISVDIGVDRAGRRTAPRSRGSGRRASRCT